MQIQRAVRPPGDLLRPGRPGLGLHRRDRPLGPAALALGGGRVRLDRLRLHRRADALSLAVAKLLLRHHRSGRLPQGPLLLLSQRLAAGAAGPPPAALELAGTGRQGDPRLGRHATATSVELFLNGKSLGEKKLDRDKSLHVEWSVPYAAGTLRAVAKKDGKEVADDEVRTAGKPKRLVLRPDRAKIRADGDDLSFVRSAWSTTRASFALARAISCDSIFPVRPRSPGWTTATRSTTNRSRPTSTQYSRPGIGGGQVGPQPRQDHASGRGRGAGSRPKRPWKPLNHRKRCGKWPCTMLGEPPVACRERPPWRSVWKGFVRFMERHGGRSLQG